MSFEVFCRNVLSIIFVIATSARRTPNSCKERIEHLCQKDKRPNFFSIRFFGLARWAQITKIFHYKNLILCIESHQFLKNVTYVTKNFIFATWK